MFENTASSTSSSELNPRGPNHAISARLRHEIGAGMSAGKNATGRSSNAATVKTIVAGPITARPPQMIDVPNSTNVKSSAISAVVSPYSRKQSHSSTSITEMVRPAAKAAMKPLPCSDSAAA